MSYIARFQPWRNASRRRTATTMTVNKTRTAPQKTTDAMTTTASGGSPSFPQTPNITAWIPTMTASAPRPTYARVRLVAPVTLRNASLPIRVVESVTKPRTAQRPRQGPPPGVSTGRSMRRSATPACRPERIRPPVPRLPPGPRGAATRLSVFTSGLPPNQRRGKPSGSGTFRTVGDTAMVEHYGRRDHTTFDSAPDASYAGPSHPGHIWVVQSTPCTRRVSDYAISGAPGVGILLFMIA